MILSPPFARSLWRFLGLLTIFLEFSWCVRIFWHYIILYFGCDLYFIRLRRFLLHNIDNSRLSILYQGSSLDCRSTLFDILNYRNKLVCILSDLSNITHRYLMIRVCQIRQQTVSKFDLIFRIVMIFLTSNWNLKRSFRWNLCKLQLLQFLHLFYSHRIQVNFSRIVVTRHLWLLVNSWQPKYHTHFSLLSQHIFLLSHFSFESIYHLKFIIRFFSTRRVRWDSTFTNISCWRLSFELVIGKTAWSLILSLLGNRRLKPLSFDLYMGLWSWRLANIALLSKLYKLIYLLVHFRGLLSSIWILIF